MIRVEGLSKRYRVGADKAASLSFREYLSGLVRRPFRRRAPSADDAPETFWALRDVSFALDEGEVLGVIGHNGAGKSTLLKILTGITEPTRGQVSIRGRVASLLEVGTGFHPELTGRENIFLNGTILGLSRREIRARFDEIVGFAEVERFIDTPVKRYSSGMYMRLAFAVAAHLEPEILLVDEVLSVGDVAFQKKCLGKMGNIAKSGRTVVFVSHNMDAVRRLTGRTLMLQRGRIAHLGATDEVIAAFLDRDGGQALPPSFDFEPRDPVVHISSLMTSSLGDAATLDCGRGLRLDFELSSENAVRQVIVCVRVLRRDSVVFGENSFTRHGAISLSPNAAVEVSIDYSAVWLSPGTYDVVVYAIPDLASPPTAAISNIAHTQWTIVSTEQRGMGPLVLPSRWSLETDRPALQKKRV